MSLDLATVGIALDTSQVASGEKVVTGAFGRMADSSDKLNASVGRSAAFVNRAAQAEQERLRVQREVSAAIEVGKERTRALGVAEEQRYAQEAKFEATRLRRNQQERELSAGLQARSQAEREATEAFVRSQKAQEASAATIAKVATASTGAAGGLRTVATTLSTVAAQSIGLRGGLGSLISSLGTMAVGGGVTIAVVAGITAISAAWNAFTSEAREAKDKTDALIASLLKARDARLGLDVAGNKVDIGIAVGEEQKKLEALRRGSVRQFGGATVNVTDSKAIAESEARLRDLTRARDEAEAALEDKRTARRKQEEADAKSAADKAASYTKDRLSQIASIRKAEQDAAVATATATGDFAKTEAALHAKAMANIDDQVKALTKVGDAERERLRTALLITEEAAKQARLYDRLSSMLGTTEAKVVDPRTRIRGVTTDFGNTGIDPNLKGNIEGAEKAANATRDAFIKSFESIFTRGNDGFLSLFRNIEDMAIKYAAKTAAGFAFDKLKIGKKNEDGSTSFGGTAGAVIGVGLVVGGFVASMLDHAKKAREAYRSFDEARIAFGVSLDAYVANAMGTANSLSNAIAASTAERKRQEDAARAVLIAGVEAGKAEGSKKGARIAQEAADEYEAAMQRIAEAAKADAERIRKEADDRKRTLAEDLAVRTLRAQGLGDEADTASLLIAQTRERLAIEKELGDQMDATTRAMLESAQAAEREALAKRQLIEEQRRQQDNRDLEGSTSARGFRVDARRAALAGNDKDAGAFGRQADAIDARTTASRAAFEARQMFEAGTISEVMYKQITAVIEDELNVSLAELQKQAEDSAKAIAETNRQANLDLGVRRLVLNGMTEAAEIERDRIAAEREYAQAVKDGLDATTLATLRKIQEDEAAAKAMQKLVDKTKALADAMYAQARATEDLTVRSLRATGNGGAADVASQLFAQQEERRKAIEEGRSADFIATLDRVQTEERAFADKARRDAQDAAFQAGLGQEPGTSAIADSKTSVNFAVGITESTAGQITGSLRSGLVYWSYLPTISADIKGMRSDLRNLRGLTLGEIDLGLATQGASADLVAGNPVSN